MGTKAYMQELRDWCGVWGAGRPLTSQCGCMPRAFVSGQAYILYFLFTGQLCLGRASEDVTGTVLSSRMLCPLGLPLYMGILGLGIKSFLAGFMGMSLVSCFYPQLHFPRVP